MAKRKTKEQSVAVTPLDLPIMEVPVIGISPVITHRFDEKAMKMIADKQAQETKTKKRPKRDPEAEFLASTYVMNGKPAGDPQCEYGLPAIHFKLAAVQSARHIDGLAMTELYGAFHVLTDARDLVKLHYGEMLMRTDNVSLARGVKDLRYRAEFRDWACLLRIQYLASSVTPDQVINCVNIGGFTNGVGDYRPQRRGSFGMFRVAERKEFDGFVSGLAEVA